MPRLRPIPEKPAEPPKTQMEDAELKLAAPESNEPEVIVEDTPEPSKQADLALKKQIEELRKSEGIQRNLAEQLKRDREEALKLAAAHAERLSKVERETVEQEEVALDSTRAAAKAEAAQALADYKNALDAGDNAAAADAMDRLTDAKTNLRMVESGREALKAKKKELKKERRRLEEWQAQQAQQPQFSGDPIDRLNLPNDCKDWLRQHRDYMEDKEKAEDLRHAHARAELRGMQPGHPDYLPFINTTLFGNGKTESEPEPEPVKETSQRASMMSAPVSRETPNSSGQKPSATRVTLTREEKEFAAISGVSEVDYAKNKQKLAEMKAQGLYGEGR